MPIRRNCFISYHHADQAYVDAFVKLYDHGQNLFIARGLGTEMAGDIVDSNDTAYVMRRIRELYVSDSTVTIVLMGQCTWARRYVDREIQASLRSGEMTTANGLLGIRLPTFAAFPARFEANLLRAYAVADSNYAGYIEWSDSEERLSKSIEGAFSRRTTHANRIKNAREQMLNNRQCP